VTPLHVAVANLNRGLVEFLLDHSADVNARDAQGRTPLHLAVLNRDIELVRVLLDAKADPNARDAAGLTPLQAVRSVAPDGYRPARMPSGEAIMLAQPKDLERLLLERGASPEHAATHTSPDTTPAPAGVPTGTVRVLGEVRQPGAVALKPGRRMDIIDAIAECGGLTDKAGRIEFTRDGQTRRLLWDDLKRLTEADRIWLDPGDLIEVRRLVL
jgi:hypothetical protein